MEIHLRGKGTPDGGWLLEALSDKWYEYIEHVESLDSEVKDELIEYYNSTFEDEYLSSQNGYGLGSVLFE